MMESAYSPKILSVPPSTRSSNFIKLINILGLLLSVALIGIGIWLASRHGDCEKSFRAPVFVNLGIVWSLLCICSAPLYLPGFDAHDPPYACGIYYLHFCSDSSRGWIFSCWTTFQEYTLDDYSPFIRHKLNNPTNWVHIQSCIESSNNCDELNNIQLAADYYNSDLNPIQSGCC
ncbi:hypothetical protein CY35_16G000300 [Sphagnum magellanicum]|nr:hypothetical protein CY35_16G000300 [Sphagnum magellanicum]